MIGASPTPTPMLRGAALTNYIGVARSTGIDADKMLRRAGFGPEVCDDPDGYIPAAPVVHLLTESAKESGCAGFAILMAEYRRLSALGPASLLLRHQPSVRAIIEAAIRVQRHFSDVVNLTLEDDGEIAILRWHFLPEFDRPQWVEYSIAIGVHAYRELTRGLWQAETVHFTHRRHDDLDRHKRFFQCGLEFDSGFNGLSFLSRMLDLPNALANPALAGHAERLLGLVPLGRPEGSTTERARHAIYLLIHSGSATIERVGETLGLHPRSLQRQLGQEGRTFGQLLNETRRELAQRYLAAAHHSLATISTLAGYSSQSAFTRWFAAEFGLSPAAWREQQHGRADAA